MTSHVKIGQSLHYFNPAIQQKIGWTDGYGGRGAGPYHCVCINNLGSGLTLLVYFPGMTPMQLDAIPFEDDPQLKDKGYWVWADPLAKGRFLKARERDAEEEKALAGIPAPAQAPVNSESGLDPRKVDPVASGAALT
jgi:hypothetical protein